MLLLIAASCLTAAASPNDLQPESKRPKATTPAPPVANGERAADEDEKPNTTASPQSPAQGVDDEDEDRVQPSSAIVVTARRLDTARTSIDQGLGATVYDLNNDTIENRPGGETGSVSAILSQTPGVTLSSPGLNIRGSNAVQVRINGVIVPEAISDPEDRLSSRLAESTRLITGTLPAQFGFAPGGVIAVTTKNGLYQHGGQAELFAGTDGAFEPAFEWGGSLDSSSLFGSGSLETGRTRVAGIGGQSAADIRHEIGGLGFADHLIDQQDRVSLIFGSSSERHKIGPTDLPSGIEQAGDGFATGTLQHSDKGFTVQASLFAGHATESADFVRAKRERRSSMGTQIDSSLAAGTGNTIRVGVLLTRSTVGESGAPPLESHSSRTTMGLYLQDEWKPDQHLTVNAGLRADWLRSLGSSPALQPRASIVWTAATGLTAHAGYARYASPPPLGEEAAGIRLPNEEDDYFDAGVQQKLGPVTLGADAYYRSVHDLVIEHRTRGSVLAQAFEFSRGRFLGVELSAIFARGPLSAWANVSLSKSQGRTIVGGTTLFPAVTIAAANGQWLDLAGERPVTGSGGVSWRIGKLNLSGDVLAGSGAVRTFRPSEPNGARAAAFATLGLSAVYRLKLFDGPLDVRADLTNLTNVHYVVNDAASLEGGWTAFAEGRAILVGFEQGF